MIYITGDCHGEYSKFNTERFPEQKDMTKDDFVIICGDFGLWHDNEHEQWWFKWLADKPFTTLFVDGNHENFDRLYKYPVVDFHGGKAHKINDSIYHLMRGEIFELCGKKFFAFGGARSHDISGGILDQDDPLFKKKKKELDKEWISYRINHVSWWEQELPSEEEMQHGIQSLSNVDFNVDYVISHCLPQTCSSMYGLYDTDILTMYFNGLLDKGLKFKDWYCGHYHVEMDFMGKFHVLYERIDRIE